MLIGVISDIHGNCVALDAVIADVENHRVDRWVCLGDALQGGTQPCEVLERLHDLDCPVVMGNTDAAIIAGADGTGPQDGRDRPRRDWTVATLGPRGVDVLRTFVPSIEIDLEAAGTVLCFHGGPDDYDTVLLPETPADTLRAALGDKARTMCGGHTHQQWSVSLDDWTFFNPGSVGLAYNRHLPGTSFCFSPEAEYAVLHVDDDRIGIEFLRVPFDLDELDRVSRASGHPLGEQEAGRYRSRA